MLEFLIEYVKPHFDGFALIAAVFLVYGIKEEFRRIGLTVLAYFVVSDAIYHYFFFDFREANNWAIYWMYNAVNLLVLFNLKRISAHVIITALIALSVLLNVVVSYYFIGSIVPQWVYDMYFIPADVIALLILTYLWMIGYGDRVINSKADNRGLINMLFKFRHGLHLQGPKR